MWKKIHICFLLFEYDNNEVITDIDVASPFDTWSSTIILQLDGAVIILIDDVVMELTSLIF